MQIFLGHFLYDKFCLTRDVLCEELILKYQLYFSVISGLLLKWMSPWNVLQINWNVNELEEGGATLKFIEMNGTHKFCFSWDNGPSPDFKHQTLDVLKSGTQFVTSLKGQGL